MSAEAHIYNTDPVLAAPGVNDPVLRGLVRLWALPKVRASILKGFGWMNRFANLGERDVDMNG